MKPIALLAALAVASPLVAQNAPAAPGADAHWNMLESYCYECHNATDWAGGLAFDVFTPDDMPGEIQVWEQTARKLRGYLMPPPGSKQPTEEEKESLVAWLESSLDARRETPRAGHVTAQRLSRTEYANAVNTLLGVEINPRELLPPEVEMDGFNNIAAVLTTSPSFLDQYIGAARFVARRAVGGGEVKVGKTRHQPVNGQGDLPLGAAGGFSFKHFFPADGEYRLSIQDDLTGGLNTHASMHRRTLLILVDGRQVFRGDIGGKEDLGLADREGADGRAKVLARFQDIPFNVASGEHQVTLAWVDRAASLSDATIGGGFGGGVNRFAGGVEVSGPFGRTTLGSSPSRDRIMVCTPRNESEYRPCAEQIARTLAVRAYRRPVNDADIARLMSFFDSGLAGIGDFDGGVQEIVMAVIASPDFLYRTIAPKGDPAVPQPLSPLELASRLSFFLWSDLPDDELLRVAVSGALADPAEYDRQVQRMLADRRAAALVNSFAVRWLHVDDLEAVVPDPQIFPRFNNALRQDFSTEMNLFLTEVLLQNKSILELLTADYSYLNERLASHYGMRGVQGTQFRRVQLTDVNRHGLLGKAAILMRTSYGDRTSPVLRGAWVLERIMGTPPSPPPPGVETNLNPVEGDQPMTLRARLEVHRQAQSCNQCHGVIDPIGLALENFDSIGAWRTRDAGLAVDATTVMPNGVAINGVAQLREVLVANPQQFALSITEKLMMYGLGREVEAQDMPQVREIVRGAAADNYRFFDLVKGVVRSDAFRMQGAPHDDEQGGAAQTTIASVR